VAFTTIWPGWYRGRTVHIHAMVHVDNARVLTTHSDRTGRDTFNDGDTISKPEMLLKITQDDDGYLGVIVLSADSDSDGR
jgi:protocatechuate 3,4-dioxygenase beta subunit